MAITTMDGLVAALAEASDQRLFFPSATSTVATYLNLNQAVSGGFGQMAVPTARTSGGQAFNQSAFSTGFPLWTPVGATTCYLGRYGLTTAASGTFHVYDLLYAASGFSGNVATAQTITSPVSLPSRNTNGIGAEIWIGCSSAIGGTAHNVTVQYTNQAGTAGRNTVSTAGTQSMPANRMYQVPLQSGDTGVQTVQGMTLSATSGTAGNLWVVVAERVCSIGLPVANVGISLDFAALGLPVIGDEACLMFVNQATGGNTGITMGQLDIIHG
jgi:hypothetical protein